ncbi:hypothetical protein [Anaerotruncus colihominis]|uniref:hypothetical protein n=1 Tax=Anaerotruncus colihominis TaxID=169435 RepID=UPI00242EAF86|nr:hypothetical protein [Anaerotruncus colihominis]
MENIYIRQEEARGRFFNELSLRLLEKGIVSERKGANILRVYLDGKPVCDVYPTGSIFGCDNQKESGEARDLQYQTARIARTVRMYLDMLETAPPLPAKGLDPEDGYKQLANFGGVVLAGRESARGCQFVTWNWDLRHEYVETGHYFAGNYEGAKQDFAIRAGLVDRNLFFIPEQMTEIYRCVSEELENSCYAGDKRQQLLEEIRRQIEYGVPNLEELISQTNQNEINMSM